MSTTGGADVPSSVPPAAPRRRVRNFLLDTSLQLRLASYLVAVAIALSVGLGALLWKAYREASALVALSDPDVSDSIAAALAREDRLRVVWLAAALAAILVCLLGAAVVITHRIAGPAYAIGQICRQVGEGRLTPPRSLRARDLLVDLADDVAAMVAALRAREESERAVLAAAAAAVRDGAPAAREDAAATLERLAAEKTRRLQT